jgi:hypothetical protein
LAKRERIIAFMKNLLLAAFLALALCSCDDGFNREHVRSYVEKYLQDIQPSGFTLVIQEIGPVQKMTLHGEELLTVAVPIRFQGFFEKVMTVYLISSPNNSKYLIGQERLMSDVDMYGYAEVARQIDARNAAD